MGKVIDFKSFLQKKNKEVLDNEETESQYIVAELTCLSCGKRWVDAFPVSVWLKDLECPYCKEVGRVINTGQEIVDPLEEFEEVDFDDYI